jgi:gas vesicle protein
LGILLAPDAGEQTRTTLADKAKDAWEQVKDKVGEGEDTLNQYKDEAKSYKDQSVIVAKSNIKEKANSLNDKIQNA